MPSHRDERAIHNLAKRRAGYLKKNPGKMLGHDRYWSSLVVGCVLEHGEHLRLTDPDGAWEQLRWLPQTIERVPVGRGSEHYKSVAERTGDEIRALALLGEVAGLAGRYLDAEGAFNEARRRLISPAPLAVRIAADYHQRLGAYVLRQGRAGAARDLFDRALDQVGEPGAELLLLAGCSRESDGSAWLAESLRVNPVQGARGVNRRLAAQACTLLARDLYAHARCHRMSLCSKVLDQLAAMSRRVRGALGAFPGFLLWIEGLATWGTGLSRLAERRLSRAHQTLLKVGDVRAAAWIGVDLAELMTLEDQAEQAEALLGRTSALVDEHFRDAAVVEALGRALTLAPDAFQAARDLMVRRLPLDGLSAYPLGLPPSPSGPDSVAEAPKALPSPAPIHRWIRSRPLALVIRSLEGGPGSFVVGVREELLTQLITGYAKMPHVWIIDGTGGFTVSATAKQIELMGSIRRQEGRVNVAVRLVSDPEREVIHAVSFDLEDNAALFTLQADVGHRIMDRLIRPFVG